MTLYSVQPTDRNLSKAIDFLSFAKNIGKNRSKNFRFKNLLVMLKNFQQMYLKLHQKE